MSDAISTDSPSRTATEPAWKADLEDWALGYCARMMASDGHAGVILGGSIARGQQWEHSDLELGYLRSADTAPIDYFATDSGRGVERIPLTREDLERDLPLVEGGDPLPVASWPIQLFQGRVLHDPSGLLGRFMTQFDRLLFSREVVQAKIATHLAAYRATAELARQALDAGKPRVALIRLRWAMNELILVQYWTRGELPRSQNRTDSRLRDLAERHGIPEFYRLYRDVYDLDSASSAIANDWPVIRDEVLGIAATWIGGARDFFDQAVDSNFAWGEDGGIIGVYRIYIPIIGGDDGLFATLDDAEWAAAHPELIRFLGLTDPAAFPALLARTEEAAARLS